MLGCLTPKQIQTLLQSEVVGRIGCHYNGLTYVVPVTYSYENDNIYCHTREGLKVDLLRKNPKVCFEVDRIENMVSWQSAIVQGEYEELTGYEADAAMQILSSRIMPLSTSETAPPRYGLEKAVKHKSSQKNVVFRIRIHEMTGRYEKIY